MAKKDIQLKILSGKHETEKYEVTGFEALIPEIRKLDKELEELSKKRESIRDTMMNHIKVVKQNEEEKGALYKTFVIASTDGVPASVVFKNAFSKLGIDNEEVMRKFLGDEVFATLFRKEETLSLKSNVDLDALKKILGDKAEVFFETKKFIAFEKEFMEKRAALRKDLKPNVNAQLDKWAVEHQAKPDLRLKG